MTSDTKPYRMISFDISVCYLSSAIEECLRSDFLHVYTYGTVSPKDTEGVAKYSVVYCGLPVSYCQGALALWSVLTS